jgi:hypothetical protein
MQTCCTASALSMVFPTAISVGYDKLFANHCNALYIKNCITDERFTINVKRCENHVVLKDIY